MSIASQCDAKSKLALISLSLLTLINACKNNSQNVDAGSRTSVDGTNINKDEVDELTPLTTATEEYLFLPPFEDSNIMGHRIKWIHRFPITNIIKGFTDVAGSLYFLAAGNSVIEKTGDKWILHARLDDEDLHDQGQSRFCILEEE